MEHDRTWKEWNKQFSEISKKTGVVLQEINVQTQDVKRSSDGFNEISQRFERRMNELTEMYRILEERLRQDWATYKPMNKNVGRIIPSSLEKNRAIF